MFQAQKLLFGISGIPGTPSEGVPLTLNIGMATGATVVDSFSRLMLASRSIRRERPALPSGMLDGLARMTPRSDRPPLEATVLRFGSTVS